MIARGSSDNGWSTLEGTLLKGVALRTAVNGSTEKQAWTSKN
jgi:hypothetical protein